MLLKNYDSIFEGTLFVLMAGSLLAWGAVHPWAWGLLTSASLLLLSLRVFKAVREGEISAVKTPLLLMLPLLLAYLALQFVPLPAFLLEALSPGRAAMRKAAGVDGPFDWFAVNPHGARATVLFHLSLASTFFLCAEHFRTKERVQKALYLVVVLGTALGVSALMMKAAGLGGKSFFPFINKNHFAGYMELAIPAAAAAIYMNIPVGAWTFGLKDGFILLFSGRGGARVVALSFSIAVMGGALLTTGSRGGIIGLVVGIVAFGMLVSRKRAAAVLVPVALLAALSVAMVKMDEGKALERIGTLAEVADDVTGNWRFKIWTNAAHMWQKSPVFGVGPGSFENAFPSHKEIRRDFNIYQPESDYLFWLTELGAVGLAVILAGLFVYVRNVSRSTRHRKDRFPRGVSAGVLAALFSLLLHGVVDVCLHVPAILFQTTVLAAIAFTTVNVRMRTRKRSDPRLTEETRVELKGVRRPIAACAGAAAMLLAAWAASSSAADIVFRSAMETRRELAKAPASDTEGYESIISKLELAEVLDPGNHAYGFEKGLAYASIGDVVKEREREGEKSKKGGRAKDFHTRALGCFQDSLALFPYSSYTRIMAARMLEKTGKSHDAEKELRRAVRLNKTSAYVIMSAMHFYRRQGEFDLYRKYMALVPMLDPKYNKIQMLSLKPDKSDFAYTGEKVTWTASARALYGKLEYRYYIKPVGAQAWSDMPGAKKGGSFVWDTTSCAGGYLARFVASEANGAAYPEEYVIEEPYYILRKK